MVTVQKSEVFQTNKLMAFGKNLGSGQPVIGFQRLEFKVFDHSDQIFVNLLKDILGSILNHYKVYLIFVESTEQPKSTVRTHKKFFYDFKKQGILKSGQVCELEIPGDASQTLMAAILKLDADLLNKKLEQLIDSNLRFIYILKKGARSFPISRARFLEKIVRERSRSSVLTNIEMGKLLPFQKNILNIKPAVGNTEAIELFIRKDDKNLIETLRKIEIKYQSVAQN